MRAHAQGQGGAGQCAQHHHGRLPALAIFEQQRVVTPDVHSRSGARQGLHAEGRIRAIAPGRHAARCRPDAHTAVRVRFQPLAALAPSVVAVPGQLVRHQKAARRALEHPEVQIDGVIVVFARPRLQPDQALRMRIPPGGAAAGHGKRRRQQQLTPLPVQLHEHALAGSAAGAQVTPQRGQDPVGADMAFGQHGGKHARHPAGGRQAVFIGAEMRPGAQQVPVRAQHLHFLAPGHHMALIRPLKEGQQLALGIALDMVPVAATPALEFFHSGVPGLERWLVEHAGDRHLPRLRHHGFGTAGVIGHGRQHAVGPAQIGRAGRLGMVPLQGAGEHHLHLPCGLQVHGHMLQGVQGMLVLQSPGRQVLGAGQRGLPHTRRQTQGLQAIGGPGDGPRRGQREQGRMLPLRIGQVLPRDQHGAGLRVRQGAVVEVLADVELVDAHRLEGRQRHILQQHRIHHAGAGPLTADLQAPAPPGLIRRQRTVELDLQAGRLDGATPLPALHLPAPTAARTHQGDGLHHAIALAQSQVQGRGAGLHGGTGEQLQAQRIEHQGVQGAVGVKAGTQACGVVQRAVGWKWVHA